jgi:cytochrome b561
MAEVIAGPGSAGYGRSRVARRSRYTAAAQGLHWISALLMLAILPILALSVLRVIWRASHAPPALPSSMARAESVLATASHWALYIVLFAMPISGYLISAAGGHPVRYFGLFDVPTVVPADPQLARAGLEVHLLGQWAVYALIVLHIAATAFHVVVRRDGVLDRMLPEQDGI